MKVTELRLLGEKELGQKIEETKKELMKLNAQIATGTTPKSPGQIKNYKKTIAKIYTVLKEKELQKNE